MCGTKQSTERRFPSSELIERTVRLWEPRLGRKLSDDDARRIIENAVGYFRILQKWSLDDQRTDKATAYQDGGGSPKD
jgi:hypothetical protein